MRDANVVVEVILMSVECPSSLEDHFNNPPVGDRPPHRLFHYLVRVECTALL